MLLLFDDAKVPGFKTQYSMDLPPKGKCVVRTLEAGHENEAHKASQDKAQGETQTREREIARGMGYGRQVSCGGLGLG
jgi:hypothetical protein